MFLSKSKVLSLRDFPISIALTLARSFLFPRFAINFTLGTCWRRSNEKNSARGTEIYRTSSSINEKEREGEGEGDGEGEREELKSGGSEWRKKEEIRVSFEIVRIGVATTGPVCNNAQGFGRGRDGLNTTCVFVRSPSSMPF